jgi:hypothetical protein
MSVGLLAVARALTLIHVVTLLRGIWLGWARQSWLPTGIVLFTPKTPYRDLSTKQAILVKNHNWQCINGLGVLGTSFDDDV